MSSDSQRFASAVIAAFHAAGRTTDHDIGKARGPSTTTMTKLRNAAKGVSDLAEPRSQTWAAIDRAANWQPGTAKRVWAGEEPGPAAALPAGIRPIGDPEDDLVEFTVEGNFGVRAVVKGPIRDMDALQSAVSKLIAGMQVEESTNREMP